MKVQNSQISANFVLEYVRDIESLTLQRVPRHHHEDGIFRFGKQNAVQGEQDIKEALALFLDNYKNMAHKECEIWVGPKSAVFCADVSFPPIDDTRFDIPMILPNT